MDDLSDDALRQIYADVKTIAVVGASTSEGKAGNSIPRYLQSQGYRIVPVSPRGGEILGERAYASLDELDVAVDAIDVFRPPAEAVDIATQAPGTGARVLWFQPGTGTEQAYEIARGGGMTVVWERCMGVTHGRLGLGPGPSD